RPCASCGRGELNSSTKSRTTATAWSLTSRSPAASRSSSTSRSTPSEGRGPRGSIPTRNRPLSDGLRGGDSVIPWGGTARMSDERETLELDVVFVGAGPASLAGAYHLARLARESGMELAIGVLEKGREITSHALSGAVVDPRALRELFPDDWRNAPFEGKIEHEKLLFLNRKRSFSLPIPPPLENEGNYVASLGKLLKWMAPKVEAAGVDIFFEFPA